MAKMRVIIKRADEQYGHVTHISSRLGNLQNTVGGNIETVFLNDDLVVICNEEGKLLNLPYNMKLMGDVIVGTIIVCSVDGDGFTDLKISFDHWKDFVDQQQKWGCA